MPARRQLAFDSLDAAVADARHLLVAGYARAGNWSLGQCGGHLAAWVRYPLDGFPRLPLPVRVAMWVTRNTAGPAMRRTVFATGRMAAGLPTLAASVRPADADDVAGVAEFEREVERLKRFTGTPHPSPLIGPLTAEELVRATCIHAAHHFSFLVPPDAMNLPPAA